MVHFKNFQKKKKVYFVWHRKNAFFFKVFLLTFLKGEKQLSFACFFFKDLKQQLFCVLLFLKAWHFHLFFLLPPLFFWTSKKKVFKKTTFSSWVAWNEKEKTFEGREPFEFCFHFGLIFILCFTWFAFWIVVFLQSLLQRVLHSPFVNEINVK